MVIHCAGIAHQKLGVVDLAAYMRVSSEAAENLARMAAEVNPRMRFIFLSSVSVYEEEDLNMPVGKNSLCLL
ncbi:MAG: NAD-dependent epimerase/dehydratase family protein [Candidatus Omnitrophota bacterium]